MQDQNNMDEVIQQIREYTEKLKKAGQLKEGEGEEIPEEEKIDNPGFILYDKIADTTIEILTQPKVLEPLNKICDKLGPELATQFTEMLAVVMTHSAFASLVTYDDLLKVELTNQFNRMVEGINTIAADNNAHKGVLEVYKKRMDEMEKRIIVLEEKK